MGSLLDRYPRGPAYDEMFGADGLPHPHMRALYDVLQPLTGDDLARRAEARDRSFRDQGVVFSHAGEEWVFPLDLIPRLMPAAGWELVGAGVVQGVRTPGGVWPDTARNQAAERRASPPRGHRYRPRSGGDPADPRGQPASTLRHVLR